MKTAACLLVCVIGGALIYGYSEPLSTAWTLGWLLVVMRRTA